MQRVERLSTAFHNFTLLTYSEFADQSAGAMKLSEFLTFKNLSAKDFAATVKVSEASVSNWASGESLPRLKQMREIFAATGGLVTPNDFCGISAVLMPVEGQPQ